QAIRRERAVGRARRAGARALLRLRGLALLGGRAVRGGPVPRAVRARLFDRGMAHDCTVTLGASVRGVRAVLLLAVVGLPGMALSGPPDLVAEGERWWTRSPDPANPVACATCHWDPGATRGWAASFPKWKPLPRLALLEKGEIHNNVWDRGILVDASGRFTIELPGGGQYGLHVYASGYIYSPQAVRVEAGKTLEVSVTLVPEPTRANDPVIK